MGYLFPFNAADFADVPFTDTLGPGNGTMACWIKFNAAHLSTEQAIISNYNGIGPLFRFSSTPKRISFFWVDSGLGGHEAIGATDLDTDWHHIAARYIAATNKGSVFLDGVKDGEDTGGFGNPGDTKWTFGQRAGGGTPLHAVMSRPVFFSDPLSDLQIAALATGINPALLGLGVQSNAFCGYWPMMGNDNGISMAEGFPALTIHGTLAADVEPPVSPNAIPGYSWV